MALARKRRTRGFVASRRQETNHRCTNPEVGRPDVAARLPRGADSCFSMRLEGEVSSMPDSETEWRSTKSTRAGAPFRAFRRELPRATATRSKRHKTLFDLHAYNRWHDSRGMLTCRAWRALRPSSRMLLSYSDMMTSAIPSLPPFQYDTNQSGATFQKNLNAARGRRREILREIGLTVELPHFHLVCF